MCSDLDRLVLFPKEFCKQAAEFDWSNELTQETKDRLKSMGIVVSYYCSMGKGVMVRCSSDDLLALTLAFEGFEDQGAR